MSWHYHLNDDGTYGGAQHPYATWTEHTVEMDRDNHAHPDRGLGPVVSEKVYFRELAKLKAASTKQPES